MYIKGPGVCIAGLRWLKGMVRKPQSDTLLDVLAPLALQSVDLKATNNTDGWRNSCTTESSPRRNTVLIRVQGIWWGNISSSPKPKT